VSRSCGIHGSVKRRTPQAYPATFSLVRRDRSAEQRRARRGADHLAPTCQHLPPTWILLDEIEVEDPFLLPGRQQTVDVREILGFTGGMQYQVPSPVDQHGALARSLREQDGAPAPTFRATVSSWTREKIPPLVSSLVAHRCLPLCAAPNPKPASRSRCEQAAE
jgi:hypothetical protein